jgi:hypothetical protein
MTRLERWGDEGVSGMGMRMVLVMVDGGWWMQGGGWRLKVR